MLVDTVSMDEDILRLEDLEDLDSGFWILETLLLYVLLGLAVPQNPILNPMRR